ncbi:MAG: alpha/beta fold hydrolase [Coprococcus sp.]
MTIHEFGKENKETIILIHPSVVKWDYFENVIPLLEKNYHLLVPALPGYDFDNDNDFTSVEQIASDLNNWIKAKGFTERYMLYMAVLWAVPLRLWLRWDRRLEYSIV